ncbi:MAG TPA: rod shape-determining protein MreD [Verrucomicrobiae bacterium]|nr:rod shape-determining protein MreD [Verrucomicrobiae bacterium]
MNTLIAIAGILIAVALQAHMPTLTWIGGVRVEFLPALVVYAALTMHRRRALMLALAAGLAQDSLSAAPFGISALAYGITTLVITSLREALDRDLPWVQWSAGASTSLVASVLVFFVIGLSFGNIIKMFLVASLSGALTVVLFFVADYARLAWGFE